jgi:hypothetical protein
MRLRTALVLAATALLAWPALAPAQVVGAPVTPIPTDPPASDVPTFTGRAWTPKPVSAPALPQNPFMAPNGSSNLHDDAYMTDTYERSGPLGSHMSTASTLLFRECASITFDSRGRIVTICVGLDRPVLTMLDPQTLEVLATMPLPFRNASPNTFSDFSGGGYFYLDNLDRAVFPTTSRHIFVVAETDGPEGPGFTRQRDYDLTGVVPDGDGIISVLPDWSGRLWFATKAGIVGTVDPSSGLPHILDTGEPIGNSFAVDETGGVFIVSDAAMYRFDADSIGRPTVTWRKTYPNIGVKKPGQTEAGSGTTPTLIGSGADGLVAITDNADPMAIVVYKRAAGVTGNRLVCRQKVFKSGASATDQSLIAAGDSIITENNYGYSGVTSTEQGGTTSPGIERVDLDPGGGCHRVWTSPVRAPSVVPKLSLGNGLVYTYTKPLRSDGKDAWYFTALDFRTGKVAYARLAGVGFGFNNNFAPVTLGPDGTAYVGVLGGLTLYRDGG